eukprot:scaffold1112_cov116-Isochrysis_galbana.AAC.24
MPDHGRLAAGVERLLGGLHRDGAFADDAHHPGEEAGEPCGQPAWAVRSGPRDGAARGPVAAGVESEEASERRP